MFCGSCGNKFDDPSGKCPLCGTQNEVSGGNQSPNFNFNSGVSNKIPINQSNSVSRNNNSNRYQVSVSNGRFVKDDEVALAVLKNGVVSNIVSGEGFMNEDAVITNKRLYYNHSEGILNRSVCEEKIDIDDITGTKIQAVTPIGTLILSIIMYVIAIIVMCFGEPSGMLAFLIFGTVLLAIFFIRLKKHLLVEYAGGKIAFSVKKYGMNNIRHFQKCIHAIKDQYKNR